MRFVSRFCSAILMILGAVIAASSQQSPLVISGSLYDVKIAPPAVVRGTELAPGTLVPQGFDVRVRLHFYNSGDTPIIILPPGYAFPGTIEMLFTNVPDRSGPVLARAAPVNTVRSPDYMQQFLRSLEYPLPTYPFVRIPARGFVEAFDTVRVTSGYRIDNRPNKQNGLPDVKFVNAEHPFFRLRFSATVKNAQLTAKAARTWRDRGELLLSENGNFVLETEAIVNKLPD
jgi:hypothetical protein